MIRAIIKIARELNIGVIAEGVETEEQRALLASTGSTHAQGYLFGEAVAAGRADQMLRAGSVKPMLAIDEVLLEHPRLSGNQK
jgi:EAL domain-containing protein (putative c-di-GMP-specific phosphodiesterase class I)